MYFSGLFFIFLLLRILYSSEVVEDWPDWRGPYRDGTWHESGIVTEFETNPIRIRWSAPVAAGYSGPTVSEQRVYLTDRLAFPENKERVLCFNALNGEEIWTFSYDCDYVGIGYPAGPRASVIIDGDRAYSLGAMGHLFCFKKASGRVVWSKDLNREYLIRMPTWGISSAPLIVEEKIILNIGGSGNACVVALDKMTGKELWRSLDDDVSYSAPILIEQAGKPVIIVWTAQHVVGMDPATGTVYWEEEFRQEQMTINIASPVYGNGYVFVSNFFDGSLLLKLEEENFKARRIWRRAGRDERHTDALHCCISTPLLKENYIYGVDSYGELRCLELMTGDRVWENLTAVKQARWANIHLVQNGDLTYLFNENGELIIARLSEKGFEELSRAKLIEPTKEQLNRGGEGVTWAHPAFANRHVFARSDQELVCADLSAN
jgi:outer membrane protein assembly factor BamB